MKVQHMQPPRVFRVGQAGRIEMRDVGRIALDPDEQVTFITADGAEYDVARKSWGFYATPSMNDRLPRAGLRAVLVRNLGGRYYVLLVERGHEEAFRAYAEEEGQTVVSWLDTDDACARLERALERQ